MERRKRLSKERENISIEINEIVENNFFLKNCSKCDDNNHYMIDVNSQGTGINMSCLTCEKKVWFKSRLEFEDGKKLRTLWEEFLGLNNRIPKTKILSFETKQNEDGFEDLKENYKSRKRESIPQNIKDKVWNRDGGQCVQCGSNENLEFDHIIPHSKGGADTYRNLQLLCELCNRSKSNKIG